MSTDFHVTIHGTRGEEWQRVAGTNHFPVKSPIPSLATLPGYSEPQRVFMLDIPEIEAATLSKIVAHLSEKFQVPLDEAEQEIRAAGIPILAADCSVMVEHPQKWF